MEVLKKQQGNLGDLQKAIRLLIKTQTKQVFLSRLYAKSRYIPSWELEEGSRAKQVTFY